MSVNKVIIVGNIGNEPEIKQTTSNKMIANLSVATSESWRDQQGQQQERTEWHRISVFGKSAEFIQQYVHKGDMIYCEGQLKTTKYTDKNGIDRYSTGITSRFFELIHSKEKPHHEQVPQGKPQYASKRPEDFKMQHADKMKISHQPKMSQAQPAAQQPTSDDAPWDDDIPF